MKKKLLAVCLAFLLISALFFGAAIGARASSVKDPRKTVASILNESFGLTVEFRSEVQMLDLSGVQSITYLEFTTEDGIGYAIFDKALGTIEELALNHPINVKISEKTMYGGPNVLLEIVEDEEEPRTFVKDLIRGKNRPFTASQFEEMAKAQTNARQNALDRTNTSDDSSIERIAYPLERKLPGADQTGWLFGSGNCVGDCGINAIAMVEKYYDLYISNNTLPDNCSTESNIKWTIASYMNQVMGYDYANSLNIMQISEVLNSHSAAIGLNGYAIHSNYGTFNWNAVYNKLSANRPVILGLMSDPLYNDHAVVACGYLTNPGADLNLLYINDGWGTYKFIDTTYVRVYTM